MKKLLFLCLLFLSSVARAGVVRTTSPVDGFRLGGYVMSNGLFGSTTTWHDQVQSAHENGLRLIRWNFDMWGQVETSSGVFDWSKLDQFVNIATDTFNMDLVLIMPISADWMPVSGGCPKIQTINYTIFGSSGTVDLEVGRTHCPATDPALVKRFAEAVAARYCNPQKIYAQAWNEPDYPLYWKGQENPSTQEYLDEALKPIYDGVKAGCPTMDVLVGGLFDPRGALRNAISIGGFTPASTAYSGNYYWYELLRKTDSTLARSATSYFDIADLHVYNDFLSADMSSDISAVVSTYTALVGSAPRLWVTETSTTGGAVFRTTDTVLEEYRKQQWATYALPVGWASGAERIIWHSWVTGGDFSAMNDDLTERPVAGTIRRLLTAFDGSLPYASCSSGSLVCLQFANASTLQTPTLWIRTSGSSAIGGVLGTPPYRTRILDVYGTYEYLRRDNFDNYVVDQDPKIAVPTYPAFETRVE